MTVQDMQAAVDTAIELLCAETPPLDFNDVHERSIAHRLAVHLEPEFEDWNVDCEYDRDGLVRKSVLGIAQCDSRKATDKILPDIIVHNRQKSGREHNLLVIEMKKNASADACDQKKLELLTNPTGHYQYQLGLYLNVDGGRFVPTWFKDGRLLDVCQRAFKRGRLRVI